MTPERWKRTEELYHAARARPPEERAAFVAEASRGDDELRRDVESLLNQPVSADGFLAEPAVAMADDLFTNVAPAALTGRRVGAYHLQTVLGAGGMGEVYRARDTKLGRDVAIKILPSVFTSDPDRLARFEREARMLAALNHPNVCAIYGLEESGGVPALVMELVEGEDLSRRIARGIPIDESLLIARQIVEALESAHEQGIIHRDLKPANIKVRPDGTVKVLDFGLAKAMDPASSSSVVLTNSPTLTVQATQVGLLLGTAAYMSPEQALGKAVDRRADIWAFGVVLYEMLTGQRAFKGEHVSDTLAAVLRGEPDWTALPPGTPTSVRTLLRRCLEKDRKRRLDSAAAARLEIDEALTAHRAADGAAASAPPLRSAWSRTLTWTLAASVFGLAIALALWSRNESAPGASPPARVSVMLPANRPISISGFPTRSVALSPDGTQLVYVGTNLDAPADQLRARTQLQLRSLGSLAVRDLPGTTGARQPFFSPDGQWVGFFTVTDELKKVSLGGGNPITLLTKINGANAFGVWTEDDTIVFSSTKGLRRVPADGGAVSDLTTSDADRDEISHRFPTLVPSRRAVLFDVRYNQTRPSRIEAVMLDSKERRVVVENGNVPLVLSSGHLLFQRNDTILIAPFDAERMVVTGPAVPLVDDIRRDSATSPLPVPELAVSRSGTLVYVPPTDNSKTLGLVGRDGAFEPLGPPPGNFFHPRVSPDGRNVALAVSPGNGDEVRVYDLERGSTTKLTQEGVAQGPAWHPNGRSLAITSSKKDAHGIFIKNLDGSEQLLVTPPSNVVVIRNASWSPDGKQLVYTAQTAGPPMGIQTDIWVLTMGDKPEARPLLNSTASEFSPKFSPNGRWLSYVSDESGRPEVYVRGYPQGERIPISTGGGNGPVWRPDGREVFFQGLSEGVQKMMAVSVTPDGDTLRLTKPIPLFDMRVLGPAGVIEQYAGSSQAGVGYDILPDGKRFLMIRGPDPTGAREIVLVQHWFEELKQRVPTK